MDGESRRVILEHMNVLTEAVERQMQAADGKAAVLQLPAPKTGLEREAMRLFLREVELASGMRCVKITTGHGNA
jgi:hypothetical protein